MAGIYIIYTYLRGRQSHHHYLLSPFNKFNNMESLRSEVHVELR